MLQISEQLRDVLVKYLATRPYQEVAQGITELVNLKPYIEKNDDRGDTTKNPSAGKTAKGA